MKKVLAIVLALVMVLSMTTVAFAAEDTAATPEELRNKVANANDGDIIKLTADMILGTNSAGTVNVTKNVTIDGDGHTVTIEGDDADYEVGAFTVSSTTGATIKNIIFVKLEEMDTQESAIYFNGAKNVLISGCTFHGPADVANAAQAIAISGTYYGVDGLTVENCTFKNLKYAIYLNQGSNVTIINNAIDGTRYNAVNVAGDNATYPSENIVVDNNTMTNISADNYGDDEYSSAVRFGVSVSGASLSDNDITTLNNKKGVFVDDASANKSVVKSGTFSEPVDTTFLSVEVAASVSGTDATTYYTSVDDAIAAAKPGETVVGIGGTGYTVTFDYDDEVTADRVIGNVSTAITMPAPTRTGYTFQNWTYTDGTVNGGASFTPSADVTFTAVWEADPVPSSGGGGAYMPEGHTVTSPFTGVDKVYVDGSLVKPENYTTYGGNIILNQKYLDSLKAGTHSVKIVFGDRQATGTFTTKGAGTVQSAKTFDAGIAVYGMMAVASVAGAVYVTKKHH